MLLKKTICTFSPRKQLLPAITTRFVLTSDGQILSHCAERRAETVSQWTKSDAKRRDDNTDHLSVRQLEDIYLFESP